MMLPKPASRATMKAATGGDGMRPIRLCVDGCGREVRGLVASGRRCRMCQHAREATRIRNARHRTAGDGAAREAAWIEATFQAARAARRSGASR